MKKIELNVSKKQKLLDYIIKNEVGISFNTAQKLLRKKDIKVNGKAVTENIDVEMGDSVVVFINESTVAKPNFFTIAYQDDNVLIADKTAGIILAKKDINETNKQCLQELIEVQENCKLYVLHRLDRNTGGLVMFAKNKNILNLLKLAMKNGEIGKIYFAKVNGRFPQGRKLYSAYLSRNEKIKKVYIDDTPKKNSEKIETEVLDVKYNGNCSELFIKIRNGKTHQIRAHLAHMGYSILGDKKYNENQKNNQKIQNLNAYSLVFNFTNKDLKYLNDINLKSQNNKF